MNNILIITHGFLPTIDGGIIVAYDYANLLVDLGYNVTVISKAYPNPIQNTRFNYIQIPNKWGEYLWLFNFGYFFKSFPLHQYDCIILNQYPTSVIAGKYFSNDILRNCIPIIQGMEVESIYTNKKIVNRLFHGLLRMRNSHRITMIRSRKVVAVSNFHKWKVLKAAGLEAYADHVQVVHTGIDRNIFHPVASNFKKEMGWEDKELLISVSRIEKMKGYAEMLDVFERLAAQDDTFRWVIVGEGSFLSALKQLATEKNLTSKICFAGAKLREELSYYYSSADCFWLLSNYDECLPLVYLEAQACGLPAIGRNKGGTMETIIDGETGFLVNNEQECLNALLNKEYKKINKEDLLKFASGFDKLKATRALIQ